MTVEEIITQTSSDLYTIPDFNFGDYGAADFSEFVFNGYADIGLLNGFKIFGMILSVVMIVLFIIMNVRLSRLLKEKARLAQNTIAPPEAAQGNPLNSRWEEIQRHLNSSREAEWKFAVIEADKLVEDILRQAGFPGESMGEKLKNINKTQLVSIDDLWYAHKIRNRLAHDVNYFLRYGEAKRAIQLYEKALRELNAL